jgi:hypothetical protein
MTASPTKHKSGKASTQIAEVPTPATRPCNSDPNWIASPGHFAGVDTEAVQCYNTLTHTKELKCFVQTINKNSQISSQL